MGDFEVGDIIKGIKLEEYKRYGITNEKMLKAKVLKLNKDIMDIEILEHLDKENIGKIYPVRNSFTYFQYCYPKLNRGDLVKINKRATIEDLISNYWEGCQLSTTEFIKEYAGLDKEFVVDDVDGGAILLKGIKYPVTKSILRVVGKAHKEMTIGEIEKELGYKVKIIKDE